MALKKLILSTIFLFSLLFAEGKSLVFKNFTTNDGLASNKVYDITQDEKNNIWLATEKGISVFDGFHFTNYQLDTFGFDEEVMEFHRDYKNRIWFITLHGNIGIIQNGKITPYAYNSKLNTKESSRLCGNSFFVDENDNVYFQHYKQKGIVINSEGKIVDIEIPKSTFKAVCAQLYDEEFSIQQKSSAEVQRIIANFQDFENPDNPIKLNHPIEISGELYYGSINTIHYSKTLKSSEELEHLNGKIYVLTNINNQLVVGKKNGGLYKYNNGYWNNIIEDISPTAVHRGTQNEWMIASEGNGFFIELQPEFETVDFTKGIVKSIEYTANDSIYFSSENKIHLHHHTTTFTGLSTRLNINHLLHSQYGFQVTDGTYYYYQKENQLLPIQESIYYPLKDKTILVDGFGGGTLKQDQDATCSIGSNDVSKIKKNQLDASLFIFSKDSNNRFIKNNDPFGHFLITSYQKYKQQELIATYSNGIQSKLGDSIRLFLNINKVIEMTPDRHGQLLLLGQNQIYKFADSLQTLLTSTETYRKLIYNQDCIWILGDHSITLLQSDSTEYQWIKTWNYAPEGLDELISFEVAPDYIYIGTQNGLAKLNKKWFYRNNSLSPTLSNIFINNQPASAKALQKLQHFENNLKITFEYKNFTTINQRLFRYRICEFTDWKETKNNEIILEELAPNECIIEVEFLSNNLWEPAFQIPINISIPFWQSAWFILFCILLTIGISYLLFRKKLQKEKKKRKIEQQLKNYEIEALNLKNEALRSQINPHFIFNALSSIQGFVMNNDEKKADLFLTDFGQLMRMTLDHSSKKWVSIEDEFKLLNYYLKLEQLRLENNFQFSLQIDEELEEEEIPSIILQPFVENAIKHGMQNQTSGRITIGAKSSENGIICYVQDNGPGILKSDKNNSNHVSKGSSITQERILLMNKSSKENIELKIIDLGTVSNETGTLIELHINF